MEASLFTKIATSFQLGGGWMWAILVAHVVSIAIIVERSIVLFAKNKMNQKALAEQFEDDIRSGNLQRAYDRAKTQEAKSPVARATVAGLQAAMNLGGRDEIQSKMDEVLMHENAVLEKRTGYLAMLGNVGTLLGLLGTIVGMIASFASLANADQLTKAALLAEGISEAMHCTAYGLIMAIPALVMYAVLQARTNHLTEDINEGALKVFNWLSYAYNPLALRPSRVAAQSQRPQPGVDA